MDETSTSSTPLSRTLSTKGSFIEELGSFYGRAKSASSFDSVGGSGSGLGMQLKGPVTHAKFLSFVSRDLTANLSTYEISVLYVNLLAERMSTVVGEYEVEMKDKNSITNQQHNSLGLFGISGGGGGGDDMLHGDGIIVEVDDDDYEEDSGDEWLDKVRQIMNISIEEATPEAWHQILIEFSLPFRSLHDASPLVDIAVELDLVRFDTFLKLLREKILNKMLEDMHKFNEGGTSSTSGGKHLSKRGATAWRIYLKALFEKVDKDHSGAIDPE